ncbi:ABC transporter ATP-binding protein [Desulfobacula sp.]|uniref:ABC transporter ATP-binding protein n=1 Tax=Desulfobacula sp. TaxID=2593537 RepID=UPI00263A36EE|nr:ABC transporter ATP-binding protein [Desulfobacula sp.]
MGRLVLDHIEKSYQGEPACSDICLQIEDGEFFTFLGPSGCGKTTILRLIAGFIRPDRGRILLRDKDITRIPPEKRSIGMVFQNYALFPFMTVFENIQYGLKLQKKPADDILKKVNHYIEMVGLTGLERRNTAQLSGGEQQRVALARSLAVEPQILLLDEPLSNLDARLRDRMREELKALQKKLGITTIFVTHDQKEALTMSDRIAVFNKGVCIQTGTPEQVYMAPTHSFVAGFIGDINLFAADLSGGKWQISDTVSIPVPGYMGRHFICIRPQDIVLSQSKPTQMDYLFQGMVIECRFNGMTSEYSVTAGDTVFKVCFVNRLKKTKPAMTGEMVWIGFAKDSLQVLEQ